MSAAVAELYADVVGQDAAVARLRSSARTPVHAYLIVGPAGTGKLTAARSFAASLLCDEGGCGDCDVCRRVLSEVHPDVRVVQREGASMSIGEAAEVIQIAAQAPVEARRKILILDELHLVEEAGPALLKTMEEPPPSTVFVALAEHVPPELVTIASRCARIDFGPVPAERIVERLVAEGADPGAATLAAASSGGRPERARLLAADPSLAGRVDSWRTVPERLDGTGHGATAVVDELIAMIDGVEAGLLAARHTEELAELAQRENEWGKRGSGRSTIETRHRRERRRVRTDEIRLGLSTLAEYYRSKLGSADRAGTRRYLAALTAIGAANEALIRNPNEVLLLVALLVSLG
ncbi:MAG TPA: AAA family ATPase [Acidimicrobiales bacterium]|nr:AAA family ATPase [Acidimicrobiales bacterium]